VNIVCVFVVICVSASPSKASCCFQANAFKQVVESLSDCLVESVQLRDLVPGEPGNRQGKVSADRPSGVRRSFQRASDRRRRGDSLGVASGNGGSEGLSPPTPWPAV